MSTPNVNPLFPFEAQIQSMPSEHQYVVKNLWNVINDAQRAIPILKSQIDANKTSVAAVTSTVNTNTSSETVVQPSPDTIGFVNNQVGVTSYATTQNDYGAFILLSDASPIAVSLTGAPVIQLPWSCVLLNEGVGLVTVTPASGTISYPNNIAAASMPVAQGQAAIICFDGTNYYSVIIPVSPQDTPSILHQFVTAYNALTGVFAQAQPAFSDLSGQISPSTQMPASGVTAGSYSLASFAVNSEGLVTTASSGPTGLSVTITTAKLTTGGTQGSQTFSGGVLVSQVQAT